MEPGQPPAVHQYHREPPGPPPRPPVSRKVTLENEPELPIRERIVERRPYYERERSPIKERIIVPRRDAHRDYETDSDDDYGVRRRVATVIRRRSRDESPPSRRGSERSRSFSRSAMFDRDQFQDFGSNQSPTHFVKPYDPQDVTIHMSLPVQDDLEDVLEECSRLRRLGHFRDAIELFEDQLAHFMDNGYVLVQYSLCLFEAGEYGRLASLAPAVARSSISYENHGPGLRRDPRGPLNVMLNLLRCRAEIDSVDSAEYESLKYAAETFVSRSWPTIDSTEARLLTLIASRAFDVNNGLPDWNVMYRHLVDKGMIWEFRDILQELVQTNHVDQVLNRLTHTTISSVTPLLMDPLDRICKAWDTDSDDDSTLFALLDIFTSMALIYKEDSHAAARADKCMDLANKYALKLVKSDENNSLSRPYLRWTMAKILVKEEYPKKFEDSVLFKGCQRGTLKVPRFTFPAQLLPVYIPVEDETPVWQPNTALDRSCAPIIRAVMEAAEEVGDLEMQAACLRELMYRGDEAPEKIIKKLTALWQSAGNMHMIRIMHLFSYMLAHTPSARKQLRKDILTKGEIWRQRSLHAAQRMILGALSSDNREKSNYRYQAAFINDEIYHITAEEEWEHRDDGRVPLRYHYPPPPIPAPPMQSSPLAPVVTVGRTRPHRARSPSPVRYHLGQKSYALENRQPIRTRSPQLIEDYNESRWSPIPSFLKQARELEQRSTKPEKSSSSSRRSLDNILEDVRTAETEFRKAQESNDRPRVQDLRADLARLYAEKDDELARLREEIRRNRESDSESDDSQDDREEEDRMSQKTARVEDSAETPSEANIVTVGSPGKEVPYSH